MDRDKLPVSRRLKMNAALVPECGTVADIGCDHAYTSIYLAAGGRAARALAMDVRTGPLLRAQENIRLYGLGDRIQTRLSDGLAALSPGEADCILISGMGGQLIIDILQRGWEKALAAKCIILQPQSELAKVRAFLHKMNYRITAEDMCEEDGKYYTAMRAQKAGDEAGARPLSPEERAYGPCLLAAKHPVLRDFVRREIGQKQEILSQLSVQETERAQKRRAELLKELLQLENVLARVSQ